MSRPTLDTLTLAEPFTISRPAPIIRRGIILASVVTTLPNGCPLIAVNEGVN